MDNGTTARVVGQFDSLALMPDSWDHNRQYHGDILKFVGKRRLALDIGCGTGELTRRLALRCASVVGVDASPRMVGEARKRNWGLNIEYVEGDAAAYLEGKEGAFDCITSVAALHHMDEWRMLGLCKAALAPGGILVVLDLYKAEGVGDLVMSAAAAALNPFFYLANTGRPGTSRAEREAWAAHGSEDHYKTLGEMREIAIGALGDCAFERKLFWRYLLAYERLNRP
jgi:SAM-dependent methyltransferase